MARRGAAATGGGFCRYISDETRYYEVPGALLLECGATLQRPVVAYRTWGNAGRTAERTVLICHALTASADADRWWPGMIGPGAAFDPADDFIICANILGSCYGTTGPASIRPGTTAAYRADFPPITVRDMVRLQRMLLDGLGIERLALVTGPSLGGMQALEWAAMYPRQVAAIAPIGVGGQHSAWCIGLSEAQRAAIRADENWNDGFYSEDNPPRKGLAAARMMAVCGYRSWQGFQQRFARDEGSNGFQVESYLRYQGEKFHRRFDANCYVRLTQAMHSHDISRGRGAYPDVLKSLRQPALVVSVSSDTLYPPAEQALLARYLPNARYRTLETTDGHDGFLIETGPLSGLLAEFRQSLAPVSGAKAGGTRDALTAMPE